MMDDIAEQQYVSNEISQAISTPIGGELQKLCTFFKTITCFFTCKMFTCLFYCSSGFNYDEDELEKELEDLEQEELDKELLSTGTHAHELPEVPIGDIKAPAPADEQKKKGKKSSMNPTMPLSDSCICFFFIYSKSYRRRR